MIIYADFNNFDPDGFIRLNCSGTESDLSNHSLTLVDGMELTVSDGDLTATIIVRAPSPEGVWRGEIVGAIRGQT
ncbi:hypothetical protein [Lysobacter sp. ESA13C]|uniref:hypothetical protein n=1 Tax=Lysobacter sp. ESA13C TaxID=2862676 RepID=UPI001CBD0572|nr:hypothetical protein [Lysobacter sp. ESA13C]